jgi:lysophospholipase L1-like esterase
VKLLAKSNMETVLMVSGIPPRYGTNVQPLNMILEDLCDNNNLQFIDHTKVFNDRHGYVKQQLFHPDGIHLSKKGTSTLYLFHIWEVSQTPSTQFPYLI